MVNVGVVGIFIGAAKCHFYSESIHVYGEDGR